MAKSVDPRVAGESAIPRWRAGRRGHAAAPPGQVCLGVASGVPHRRDAPATARGRCAPRRSASHAAPGAVVGGQPQLTQDPQHAPAQRARAGIRAVAAQGRGQRLAVERAAVARQPGRATARPSMGAGPAGSASGRARTRTRRRPRRGGRTLRPAPSASRSTPLLHRRRVEREEVRVRRGDAQLGAQRAPGDHVEPFRSEAGDQALQRCAPAIDVGHHHEHGFCRW